MNNLRCPACDGNIAYHEFQLYLAVENIDHSKTKAYHPQINSSGDAFIAQCRKSSMPLAKIFTCHLTSYSAMWMNRIKLDNKQRPHSGNYC